MKKATTLVVRDKRFEIVLEEKSNMWCSVEHKYIDEDGRLNTKLNGFQMNASKSMNDCIDITRKNVEIEYLEGEGFSKAEAISRVYGFPVEIAEKLLAI